MEKRELLNNIKTNMEVIINTLRKYDIETLFNLYDLKLHDVVTMNNFNEDLFDFMCQVEYDSFEEYLEEKNCKVEHLGRTSSFWVVSEYSMINEFDLSETLSNGLNYKLQVLVNAFINEYIDNALEITINEYIDNALEITIDKDFNFTYNNDITDGDWYDMDDLKQLADLLTGYEKDLQEFIEYNITNPLEVIEYINNFKANQEKIYNEYAEAEE